jgi:murein DD-endopeptidase MepM/ murein hydrolase activator NlpD
MKVVRPVKSRVTSRYGWREHPIEDRMDFHPGTDYARPAESDDVKAMSNGTIKRAQFGTGYGNYIVIEHDNCCTLYAHLKKIHVDIGDEVSAGEVIGIIGTTGSSTAIHLHFEVREVPYSLFWAKYRNKEWKYTTNPEMYLAVHEQGKRRKASDLNMLQVADYARTSWIKAYVRYFNDGAGAKNYVTEEQLMAFFDKIGLLGPELREEEL